MGRRLKGGKVRGRRTSLVDPQNMLPTAYGYDPLNRPANITLNNAQTPTFVFGYVSLSRRNSLTRPNGIDTSYGYDVRARASPHIRRRQSGNADVSVRESREIDLGISRIETMAVVDNRNK